MADNQHANKIVYGNTVLIDLTVDEHSCILTSSTPGSTKRFKIVVDDSGTLSAIEITD